MLAMALRTSQPPIERTRRLAEPARSGLLEPSIYDELEELVQSAICSHQPEDHDSRRTPPAECEPQHSSLASRVEAARASLAQQATTCAEELLLREVVTGEFSLFVALEFLQSELAKKVLLNPDDSSRTQALLRVLREVVATNNIVIRRIENALSTVVSVRAQVQMLRACEGAAR